MPDVGAAHVENDEESKKQEVIRTKALLPKPLTNTKIFEYHISAFDTR